MRHLTHIRFGMFAIAVLVLSMGVAGLTFAETITIDNHSFEDDGATARPPTDWENINGATGAGSYDYGANISGQDGDYIAFANPPMGGSPACELWQDTSVNFVAGYTYTLEALVAQPSNTPSGTTSYWKMALYYVADDTLVSGASTSGSILKSDTSHVMVDKSFSYTAVSGDAGKEIQVRLLNTGTASVGQICFDDIRLTYQVPEPSSLVLLGCGIVGLLLLVRRRRRLELK